MERAVTYTPSLEEIALKHQSLLLSVAKTLTFQWCAVLPLGDSFQGRHCQAANTSKIGAILPKSMRSEVIQHLHNPKIPRYWEATKTLSLSGFYWGLVQTYVQSKSPHIGWATCEHFVIILVCPGYFILARPKTSSQHHFLRCVSHHQLCLSTSQCNVLQHMSST